MQACVQCGQTKTPLWRSGPAGPKTLCNACGVHYQRTVRRSKSSTPRAGSKSQDPATDQQLNFEEDAARFAPAKRSHENDDHLGPVSEPESQSAAQQVSKRPRRQRRRKYPSSPPFDRAPERAFGGEGFNRLDTLVAAAGEETNWQLRPERPEDDHNSGQTTQRVSSCQRPTPSKLTICV